MSDWYCQNSSSNINDANNWNSNPAGGGDVLTWPPASGDNLYANGKTSISINVDFDIGSGTLRTDAGSGTAGGGFTIASNRTLTCNLLAGSTACVVLSGSRTVSITGNSTGGSTAGANGISTSSGSTITLNGTATGGSANSHGIYHNSGGATIAVTNAVGGSSGTSYGIYNGVTSGVSITVTDTATGAVSVAVWNKGSSSTVTVSVKNVIGGTVINGYAIYHAGSKACAITGNIITSTACASPVVGKFIHSPASSTNYIQFNTSGGTEKYYPSANLPAAKYVYATQKTGDGATQGTLNASTIAAAKGSGSNLSAAILKNTEVVDDVTGEYTGGGASMPRARQIGV